MNNYVENVIEPMQMFNIFTPQSYATVYVDCDLYCSMIIVCYIKSSNRAQMNVFSTVFSSFVVVVVPSAFPPFALAVNIIPKNDRLKSDFKLHTPWEFLH